MPKDKQYNFTDIEVTSVYKIRNKITGMWSSGGQPPKWTKTGKVWADITKLRSHISNCQNTRGDNGPIIPDSWEIIEFTEARIVPSSWALAKKYQAKPVTPDNIKIQKEHELDRWESIG